MRVETTDVIAGVYVKLEELVREPAMAVPLLGVQVEAGITGPFSKVVMRQRFRNDSSRPIEAVYVFPAPEKAAVTGLVIETGGRRIVGRVKEKEEAFDQYDEALAAGHGAVLMDQHRPNVFQASVGNLLPGQEMVVELSWVMELGWEGESLRFALPTTVAPRYAPAEDRVGVGQTEAEKLNPPTTFEVPYGLEFRAEVDVPGGVAGIESPSHPLRMKPRGEGFTVELSHEKAVMNKDLVLVIEPAAPREPLAVVEVEDDGSAVAAVSFLPKFDTGPRPPCEVVFVIDRSGSMMGSSIDEAKRALQLCLRSLREGDRFDIVGFGSRFEPMFGKSKKYNQKNLEAATRYVERIEANMGGTEVLGPMREALERRGRGMARAVVLLTDGEVTNEGAVIKLANRHADSTRIFTIGIGHGPSEHFINGVARASGGAAEFIKPGERIEPKVLRQFARLGAPVVKDLKVEWNGKVIEERAPYQCAQLFDDEPFLVYLRLPDSEAGTVRLAGLLDDQELGWEVPVDAASAAEGNVIGALAARAEIRDLEEGTSRLHGGGGSRQRGRKEARITKAIVELGVRYQLASSQTSFVAVEEREDADDQERGRLVLVPQALTQDWGGVDAAYLMNAASLIGDTSQGLMLSKSMSLDAERSRPQMARSYESADLSPDIHFDEPASAPAGEHEGYRRPRSIDALAMLQRADGSWALDRSLAGAVESKLPDLLAIAMRLGGVEDPETVVATAAALAYLIDEGQDCIEEWRLLADKASDWLNHKLRGTKFTMDEVLQMVRTVLV